MGTTYVEVQLDKRRRVEYTFNALSDVEDLLGHPLGVTLANVRSLSARDFRALLWGGLKAQDPDLSPEKVGDLIQAYVQKGEVMALRDLVDQALTRSGIFGRPERLEQEQADRAAAEARRRGNVDGGEAPPAPPAGVLESSSAASES